MNLWITSVILIVLSRESQTYSPHLKCDKCHDQLREKLHSCFMMKWSEGDGTPRDENNKINGCSVMEKSCIDNKMVKYDTLFLKYFIKNIDRFESEYQNKS